MDSKKQEALIKEVLGGNNDKVLKKLLKDDAKRDNLYDLAYKIKKQVDKGMQMQLQSADVDGGVILKTPGGPDIDTEKLSIKIPGVEPKLIDNYMMKVMKMMKQEQVPKNIPKEQEMSFSELVDAVNAKVGKKTSKKIKQLEQVKTVDEFKKLEKKAKKDKKIDDLREAVLLERVSQDIAANVADEESKLDLVKLARIEEQRKLMNLVAKDPDFYEGKNNVYTIKNLITPTFTQDQLRHKKIHIGKEARKDLSDKYKELISETPQQLKLGKVIAPGGGRRKIIQCPYCDNKIMAAGLHKYKKRERDGMSEKQKEWIDYMNKVAEFERYNKKSRRDVMKESGRLKGKGISLKDIIEKGESIYDDLSD